MDREVLKLMAHIDQTRADVRTAIERMPPDDLVELFRDCTGGRLAGTDAPQQQLVGMLAAMAIYDLCQSREGEDDGTLAGRVGLDVSETVGQPLRHLNSCNRQPESHGSLTAGKEAVRLEK